MFHHNQLFVYILATFGNPNAGGGINNGASPIKLEAHNTGSNYYTCATYGSPSPGANEHQQSLLATSAYSKFKRKQTIITHVVVNVNNATDTSGHTHRLSLEVRGSFRSYFNRQKSARLHFSTEKMSEKFENTLYFDDFPLKNNKRSPP